MRLAVFAALALLLVGAALALAQIGLACWPPQTFIKLMASDAILIGVAAAVAYFAHERRELERLDSDKALSSPNRAPKTP